MITSDFILPEWKGRLAKLHSRDINDVAAEVPPDIGNLLVFERSGHSWHGHQPFEGNRKVTQMNWVTEQKYVDAEQRRHGWSFVFKRLGKSYWFLPG